MNQQQRTHLLELVEKLTGMPAEAFDLSKAEQRIALLVGMGLLDHDHKTDTATVELTSRELTLIRVACLQRLDPLKKLAVGSSHAEKSYDDTIALLNGKLWDARKHLPSNPTGESE